jgi:hypothetical protein
VRRETACSTAPYLSERQRNRTSAFLLPVFLEHSCTPSCPYLDRAHAIQLAIGPRCGTRSRYENGNSRPSRRRLYHSSFGRSSSTLQPLPISSALSTEPVDRVRGDLRFVVCRAPQWPGDCIRTGRGLVGSLSLRRNIRVKQLGNVWCRSLSTDAHHTTGHNSSI